MNISDAILGVAIEQGQISTLEAIRYKKLWRRQDYAAAVAAAELIATQDGWGWVNGQ